MIIPMGVLNFTLLLENFFPPETISRNFLGLALNEFTLN